MKESAAALFPRFYDERQSASGVRYVAEVDRDAARGRHLLRARERRRARRPAAAGAGAASSTRAAATPADDGRLLDPATEPARVRAMFVRADWTRRGLGRRIIEECEAAAPPRGLPPARARRDAARPAALPRVRLRAARGRRGDDARRRRARRRRDGEADRPEACPAYRPAGDDDRRASTERGFRSSARGPIPRTCGLTRPQPLASSKRAQAALLVLTGCPRACRRRVHVRRQRGAAGRDRGRRLQQRRARGRRGVRRARRRCASATALAWIGDGRRGARLGDRQHGLDVHGREPAPTRRSRRSPTSASSPSTRRRTSRSCCCCARA